MISMEAPQGSSLLPPHTYLQAFQWATSRHFWWCKLQQSKTHTTSCLLFLCCISGLWFMEWGVWFSEVVWGSWKRSPRSVILFDAFSLFGPKDKANPTKNIGSVTFPSKLWEILEFCAILSQNDTKAPCLLIGIMNLLPKLKPCWPAAVLCQLVTME